MSSETRHETNGRTASSLRLWIPVVFGLFVILGSVGLLMVFERRQQAEEREAFGNLARVNAAFMERTRLQRTERMAGRLSEVIGAEVFFRDPITGRVVGPPGAALPGEIASLPMDGRVSVLPDRRFVVGVRDDRGVEVVFVRSPEFHGYRHLGQEAWIALALFWLLSMALGFGLSRWVTTPLQSLVRALPLVGTGKDLPRLPLDRRDEIGSLARVLDQTHHSLRNERERRRQAERLALLGRMATGIAHEIRNPAAAIRLHTELLDVHSPDEFNESRRLILSEAERLENLVGQWMNYARPEPPLMSAVEMDRLLQDVVAVMEPQARHAGAVLRLQLPESRPLQVMADRQRLRQVFSNLIHNAIQAMPTGGEICIEAVRDGQRVQVSIRDQGRGFSPQALAKLGEPFFSEKEGGLGLGLAVVIDICCAHGGQFEVVDDGKPGACVRVELPARPLQDGGDS